MSLHLDLKPTAQILNAHGMGERGQRMFASEVARLCDPYVPMKVGDLKNTKTIQAGSITYYMPYARRQYYEHKGAGLRGSHWEQRMLAHRLDAVKRVAKKILAGGF